MTFPSHDDWGIPTNPEALGLVSRAPTGQPENDADWSVGIKHLPVSKSRVIRIKVDGTEIHLPFPDAHAMAQYIVSVTEPKEGVTKRSTKISAKAEVVKRSKDFLESLDRYQWRVSHPQCSFELEGYIDDIIYEVIAALDKETQA